MTAPEEPRRRRTRPADRLVYFSDAVVAIAITVLVLPLVDLGPAAVDRHETATEVVLGHPGEIGAFLLSFVVIARLWMSHHGLFDDVVRVDNRVVWVDMLWLLTIVVLPFPTALIRTPGADPLIAQLYVGVLAVNMVALAVLAVLLRRDGDEPVPLGAREGTAVSAALLVLAFVVVLFVPTFWVLLVLFVGPLVERAWHALRARM